MIIRARQNIYEKAQNIYSFIYEKPLEYLWIFLYTINEKIVEIFV